jgi:hypothetical protein
MSVRGAAIGLVATVGLAFAAVEAASVSKQQADSFAQKIKQIERQGAAPGPRGAARRTSVTEAEVNSWFAYSAASSLPTGVASPNVTIVGNQKVVGTATVDLDAIAKSRSKGGAFDIWNLVGGRVPVTVGGLLHTKDGRAKFDLQEAEVSGISVPRRIVAELVDYYSRTPDHPEGIRLDQEYELPAGIRQIELSPGTAVVIQ